MSGVASALHSSISAETFSASFVSESSQASSYGVASFSSPELAPSAFFASRSSRRDLRPSSESDTITCVAVTPDNEKTGLLNHQRNKNNINLLRKQNRHTKMQCGPFLIFSRTWNTSQNLWEKLPTGLPPRSSSPTKSRPADIFETMTLNRMSFTMKPIKLHGTSETVPGSHTSWTYPTNSDLPCRTQGPKWNCCEEFPQPTQTCLHAATLLLKVVAFK